MTSNLPSRSRVTSHLALVWVLAGAQSIFAQTIPRDFDLPATLFATDSAWNQSATGASVLPESDQQILTTYRVLRGDTTWLYPPGPAPTTWPFADVTYDEWTVPIFRAGTSDQSVSICDYEGNLGWPGPKWSNNVEGGPITVPAPAGTVRPSAPQDTDSDGHLVPYDLSSSTEYDFWQATTVRDGPCQSHGGGLTGSSILEAGAADHFDVTGSGTNPTGISSARAHGTPLLAGIILPEDIESGAIAHALGFAIPGPRNLSTDPSDPLDSDYFYPASTTETDFYSTNPNALAAGQRIRLKQTIVDDMGAQIDENQLAPITRMFLTAMRTYGAYLVDNAGGFTFTAEDISTADLVMTNDAVNALIGEPPGTPIPMGKTKWQVAMEKLNEELESIPFAYGPWVGGQDPSTATITTANYEVVQPALLPFDTTGVFRPSNGLIYLKSTNETGYADAELVFGSPGDLPVTGDWDGDGVDTIGVYRNGAFYLRNSNTTGYADLAFGFGQSGDLPVAGDWDSDGVDTVGIYRNGVFMLLNTNASAAPDMMFALGVPGDQPIAGDWNGDDVDSTGVFRPTNGLIYLKNENTTGYADIEIVFGIPNDQPMAGDWDGDGVDSIGVYRDGLFLLRNTNTTGYADAQFALGVSGDLPIGGKWGVLP